MIVVGIDPSVKATGVVFYRVDTSEFLYADCLEYKLLSRKEGQGVRQFHIINSASTLCRCLSEHLLGVEEPVVFAVEDFAYGSTATTSYDLGMFGGILRDFLLSTGYPVYLVPVAGSKAFVSGRRVSSAVGKQEARDFALSCGVPQLKGKFRQEAVADAWAAACCYLRAHQNKYLERRKPTVERISDGC